MNKCIRCNTYKNSHQDHGRDRSDTDLCDVCYWRKRAESLDAKPAVNVFGVNCHEAQYWSPTSPVVHKDDFDSIVAALQARAVVMPTAERCFELIESAFGDYKLTSETGSRVATSAALILDEVARLNGMGGV